MKIKTKISIGFTIMISIFAVFSILAFQNEQQVEELSLRTIDYTIPEITALNQIKSSAEIIPFLISEMVTTGVDETSLGGIIEDPVLIQLNNEITKFDDALSTYQSLIIDDPEESVFVKSIREKWEHLVSIIDEYTQPGEMETDEIKIRELHQELEITQRELLTVINLALDFEWKEIDKLKEMTSSSFDANFQFLVGGLGIVIVLSVIIVLIISKSVSTTVKDLEAILTGTKSSLVGKKSDRIVHEIADLSKPIQSLSDDVKKYRGRLDSIEKFENLNEFQKITYKINMTLNRIKNKPLKLEDVLVSDILDYALLGVTIPEDHTFEDLGDNVNRVGFWEFLL